MRSNGCCGGGSAAQEAVRDGSAALTEARGRQRGSEGGPGTAARL